MQILSIGRNKRKKIPKIKFCKTLVFYVPLRFVFIIFFKCKWMTWLQVCYFYKLLVSVRKFVLCSQVFNVSSWKKINSMLHIAISFAHFDQLIYQLSAFLFIPPVELTLVLFAKTHLTKYRSVFNFFCLIHLFIVISKN